MLYATATATAPLPALLEPIVTLHSGVLPPDACEGLIALGERAGFPHEGESIDEYVDREYRVSSQSIEVYEREGESPSSSYLVCLPRLCLSVLVTSRG